MAEIKSGGAITATPIYLLKPARVVIRFQFLWMDTFLWDWTGVTNLRKGDKRNLAFGDSFSSCFQFCTARKLSLSWNPCLSLLCTAQLIFYSYLLVFMRYLRLSSITARRTKLERMICYCLKIYMSCSQTPLCQLSNFWHICSLFHRAGPQRRCLNNLTVSSSHWDLSLCRLSSGKSLCWKSHQMGEKWSVMLQPGTSTIARTLGDCTLN